MWVDVLDCCVLIVIVVFRVCFAGGFCGCLFACDLGLLDFGAAWVFVLMFESISLDCGLLHCLTVLVCWVVGFWLCVEFDRKHLRIGCLICYCLVCLICCGCCIYVMGLGFELLRGWCDTQVCSWWFGVAMNGWGSCFVFGSLDFYWYRWVCLDLVVFGVDL